MADLLLEARDLSFRAGDLDLIDGLNCRIAEGRRTFLLGANGAGKSLLLRLFHGLLEPTSGEVLWRGRTLDAAARFEQAMVFQRAVMLRRTVRANLAFALAARADLSDRDNRIKAALHSADLVQLADRPARVLSGGETQRLALARALIVQPKVVLLDEPTANLDPFATQAIEALILAANADGTTVIMVSHSVGQARRLAQDVIFLHAGRAVECGVASEVMSDPQTDAAKAWLDGGLYLQ